MSHQNPTEIAPDFEDRNRLALGLLDFLGVDPALVQLDSLTIFLADDSHHRVRWTGTTRIATDELRLITRAATCPHPRRSPLGACLECGQREKCDHDGGRTLAGQCQDCEAQVDR